ncbi:MAG: tetratricopeptide repeat protein [Verrucomicrobiota bacterium]
MSEDIENEEEEADKGPECVTEAELAANLKNLYLKALSAIELRNYDYSISLLQAVLKEEPRFLDGRKILRGAEVQKSKASKKLLNLGGGLSGVKFQGQIKKDPLGAIVGIEKELENNPYNVQANQALFDAAVAAEMPETAAFALATVLEGHPDNAKVGHQLAAFHMEHDDPERAAKIFEKILEKNPADLEAIQGEKNATARASMKKSWEGKSFKETLASSDEAAELEQESRAAMTKDQMEDQLAKLSEQYAEDPNNLAVVKRIASLCEQLENWGEALTYYEWAHQLSDGDTALERRVDLMRDKQRAEDMERMEEEVKSETDEAVREEKKSRIAEMKKEQSATAIKESRSRVERNPTDPQLRFELGQALFEAGEFSDAIPELQRAKTNPHLRIRTMLMLGKCYEEKSMLDLAVRQFKEADAELFAMDGTKKDVLYSMGLVYEKLEDKEASLECFKQIYEADYGYLDVAKRVEESYGG